jgi:cytochrome bd-type quinol oxidase subunit 2
MKIYENKKALHILNASSNLLGLCFVILTALRSLKSSQRTLINKTDIIVILFFMLSSILSFFSIRGSIKRGGFFEWIADLLLFIGVKLVIFFTAILVALNVHG